MIIKSVTVGPNLRVLNDITSMLNGANKHPAGTLRGMFFRREDFESSTKQLMSQLNQERVLAMKFAKIGYVSTEFDAEVAKTDIRLRSRGKSSMGDSSFNSYDLSPALRHFMNDYCRVLEPLVRLLENKHPTISAKKDRKKSEFISFGGYLHKLKRMGATTPLDHDFFVSLYDELWNDYKHEESAGVQAGGWASDGTLLISEPNLSSTKLVYFRGMSVKEFIDKALNNMKVLLDYIA